MSDGKTASALAQVNALVSRTLNRWQDAHGAESAVSALLAELDEPPSQTTLRGLLAHEQAWRALADRWGAWSSAEVAEVVGNRNRNPHDWATAQARTGKLLAVHRAGRYVFPGYQFHPTTGTPATVIPLILLAFHDAAWDDDSIALWFTSPQGSADGAVPAEILHGQPKRVLAAAKSSAVA